MARKYLSRSTVIWETILCFMKRHFLLYWISWASGFFWCLNDIYANNFSLSILFFLLLLSQLQCVFFVLRLFVVEPPSFLPSIICLVKSCIFLELTHKSWFPFPLPFSILKSPVCGYAVSLLYELGFSAFLYRCSTKHWMKKKQVGRGKTFHMVYKWES